MSQLRVQAIPVQGIASTGLTASFQPLNTGLPESCFCIRIINGGTTPVTISYNGTDDQDVILPSQVLQLPTPINTLPNSRGAQIAKGTIVYVRGSAGASGSISLAGYYTL